MARYICFCLFQDAAAAIDNLVSISTSSRGCHCHDRMAVGSTTTCTISAYHR